jgi:peroxiredoxin
LHAVVTLAALALSALACSQAEAPKSQASDLLTRVLPNVADITLNGTAIDTSGADGLPIVVKFFSASCAPCSKTLEATQAFYEERPSVMVLGVAAEDSEREARRAVKEYGLRFPVVLDSERHICDSFGIDQPPATFVADARGRVRWVGGSDVTTDGLIAVVDSL